MAKQRKPTATSNFGVSRREGHDASGFYARFTPPVFSEDKTILDPKPIENPFIHGDARHMDDILDGSVALVITSPPYFAGKQYEEELERDGIPASYEEYITLLTDVFRECVKKLEPGGRIAVNVANLGRKPYRSLSTDVINILQDELRLLLRAEIIWQKAEGASGSCAWGSFQSAANPVIRDVTERIIVASKGRFDRSLPPRKRQELGYPHRSTILADEFTSQTLDVWSMPTESASRIGHPAPFPVELPEKLINLYSFVDDLVLDPFMGSGSTLVAAAKRGRRYAGYDLDPAYVELARSRVARAVADGPAPDVSVEHFGPGDDVASIEDLVPDPATDDENPQARASREGRSAQRIAEAVLRDAGFLDIKKNRKVDKTGVTVNFEAKDAARSATWYFDVSGAFTSHRGGLLRTDTVWKALGKANAMRDRLSTTPFVLLTTNLPKRSSEGDVALRAAGPQAFFDAVLMLDDEGRQRLHDYAHGTYHDEDGNLLPPELGFWTDADLDRDRRGT